MWVYLIARRLVLGDTAGDLTVSFVVACCPKGQRSRVIGEEVWRRSWIRTRRLMCASCVFVWFCLFVCVVLVWFEFHFLLYLHFTLLSSLIKPALALFQQAPCVCLPERTRWRPYPGSPVFILLPRFIFILFFLIIVIIFILLFILIILSFLSLFPSPAALLSEQCIMGHESPVSPVEIGCLDVPNGN